MLRDAQPCRGSDGRRFAAGGASARAYWRPAGNGAFEMQMIAREPIRHRMLVEVRSGETDMSIRTQQVERWYGDRHARELLRVLRVRRDHVDRKAIATGYVGDRTCGLTEQQQVETRVV